MREGDYVLSTGRKLSDKFIKFFTCSQYTHVGYINNIFDLEDVTQIEIIESRLVTGVKRNLYRIDEISGSIYRHIYMTLDIHKKLSKDLEEELGRPYDWMGVAYRFWLIITFRRNKPNLWNVKRAYYCSELIAVLSKKYEVVFSKEIDPENITPADIARSKFTKKTLEIN